MASAESQENACAKATSKEPETGGPKAMGHGLGSVDATLAKEGAFFLLPG
jgi:hypothetical protein